MGDYSQTKRKGRITGLLGEDDFLLRGFRGTDALSRLFTFEVDLLAESRTKVPFEKVLGQKATVHLELADGSEHPFNGLCSRFTQAGRDETFTLYRAELVPEAWLLGRKTQSRIFQHLSVPEILRLVLKGFPVRWEIAGAFKPRDYCVQYRESDLAFASRLMEEEGIFYFFEHAVGSHTMVVANSPAAHPPVPHEPSLAYEELAGGTRDDDRVHTWEKSQEVRPGKVVLWDHCFELPHKHLESESVLLDAVKVGSETHKLRLPVSAPLELYDWPGTYAQRFDGVAKGGGEQPAELQKIFEDAKRTVEIRMDEETAPAVVVRAASNVKHLVAGHRLQLRRHFNADGEYVLLSVSHSARFAADVRAGGEPPVTYENTFTCMPSGLHFRPPRVTPRPTVRGCQTAVVVGPPGEEIFCDRYGRVKVQFHWDREGASNEDSSCWIRVGTTWAGKKWGALHIPRIGQEVIVDFLEGDPDQPIIVGSVYNADQLPPWDLPENKTQSGVKSHSSLKGNGNNFNEIRFEDRKGQEEISIQAERNFTTLIKNDESRNVVNNRGAGVGGNDSRCVGKNDSIAVRGKRDSSVGLSRTSTVGTDDKTQVGGNESHHVVGTFSVDAETIRLTAKSKIVLGVGGSTIEITAGLIEAKGPEVDITTATLKALSQGLARLAGSHTSVQGSTDIEITSLGPVAVTGMPIKLNA